MHVATVNSAMMRISGISAETETEGVVKDGAGEPIGELREFPAMMHSPAFHRAMQSVNDVNAYHRLGQLATNAGMTTIGDLGAMSIANPRSVEIAERAVNAAGYPLRIVQYPIATMGGAAATHAAIVEAYGRLKTRETEMLRYGGVKIVVDGSIQGYTAVMSWPGYVNGAANGLWQVPPDSLAEAIAALHRAGIPVHVHCNGDAVIDAMIDAVDLALREHAWLDHRHTVQHCQLTTAAQFRRMAKLGICGNIFANHLWYWGDQHYESTVGPERANRMEACGTARRLGVSFSLHADAAVTPIGQLHSMWCAVNRVTPKGRVLGPTERIDAYDALAAVTIDAAYQMHLDHELGTIEVGKRADFTVLEESPLDVEPLAIKNIGVWGTVVNGEPHAASGS
jgi:predicted amidohydrolase YtcJ